MMFVERYWNERYWNKNDIDGAVDFRECPSAGRRCNCGKCAVCGYQKHTAVHGPFYGQPAGSKPYGHKFKGQAPAGRKSQ